MKKSIFTLLVFKILYSIYGVFIFGKISSIGDADAYLAAPIIISFRTFTSNTLLMGTFTSLLKHILFVDFFVHLTYCLMSFFSLKLVIEELKLTKAQEYFLVFMFILPSFGTWTSIIMKESLSGTTSCFVLIWIINIVNESKLRFPILINIIALYLTLIIRPVVGFSLMCLVSTIYLYRVPIFNKYIKFILIFTAITVFTVAAVLLTLNYVKNEFIPLAEYYFDPRFSSGKSARPLGFWKTAADFYLKAPEGIFLANLGPTFLEAAKNPFFIPYFFEGLIFIFTCIYLFFSNVFYEMRRAIINPNFLFAMFFGVILILLLNYPFGVFNGGSAIRYRSSYYHIVIVLLLFFYSREKKFLRK
jgi:hypothetical protein